MATDNTLPLDFFNYAKLNETRNAERENKPFMWPGSSTHSIFGGERKVVRGFMRSILTDESISGVFQGSNNNAGTNNQGHYRLNFQFNPESITRDVAQSIGAVNPILQNPANLTQAVPGTATFNFTMTFNREMEVNNHGTKNNYKDYADLNNPLYNIAKEKDPGVIGVWADVKMFDAIIGQGITDELISMVKVFTATQQNNINVQQNENAGEDADGNKIVIPNTYDDAEFTTAIDLNKGNSAFLNPLPVRVVFSDTFMLEGLVTGAAVAFQKFSPNMTPTICQINVNFSALYLGFAKKDAFLTTNLSNWAADVLESQEEDTVEVKALQDKLKTGLTDMQILPGGKVYQPQSSGMKGKPSLTNPYPLGDFSYSPFMMHVPTHNEYALASGWWKSDEYYHGGVSPEKYEGVNANPKYMTLQHWWNLCNSTWAASPNSYTWTSAAGVTKTDTWSTGRFNETFQLVSANHKGMMPCAFLWKYKPKDPALVTPSINLACNLSYTYKGNTSTGECKIIDLEGVWVKDSDDGYATFWLELPKDIQTTYPMKSTYSNTQMMMSAATCMLNWTFTLSKDITTTATTTATTLTAEHQFGCSYATKGFYYASGLDGLKKINANVGTGGLPGGSKTS